MKLSVPRYNGRVTPWALSLIVALALSVVSVLQLNHRNCCHHHNSGQEMRHCALQLDEATDSRHEVLATIFNYVNSDRHNHSIPNHHDYAAIDVPSYNDRLASDINIPPQATTPIAILTAFWPPTSGRGQPSLV